MAPSARRPGPRRTHDERVGDAIFFGIKVFLIIVIVLLAVGVILGLSMRGHV